MGLHNVEMLQTPHDCISREMTLVLSMERQTLGFRLPDP